MSKKEPELYTEVFVIRLTKKDGDKITRINKKLGGTKSQTVRYILSHGLSNIDSLLTKNAGEDRFLQAAEMYYPEFKLTVTRCRKYCELFQKKATDQMTEDALVRNIQSVRNSLDRTCEILNKILKESNSKKSLESGIPDPEKTPSPNKASFHPKNEYVIKQIELMNIERITLRGCAVADAMPAERGGKKYFRFSILCKKLVNGVMANTYYLVYIPRTNEVTPIHKGMNVYVTGKLSAGLNTKDGKNNLSLIVDGTFVQVFSTSENEQGFIEEICLHGTVCGDVRANDNDGNAKWCNFRMSASRMNKDKTGTVETEYLIHAKEQMLPQGLASGDSLFVIGRFKAALAQDGKTPDLQIIATEIQTG